MMLGLSINESASIFFNLSFCFIQKTLSAQSKLVSFPTSHSTSTRRHCNIYRNSYIFFQVSLMVKYNINNFLYLILTTKAGLIPGSTCNTHQGAFFHTEVIAVQGVNLQAVTSIWLSLAVKCRYKHKLP